MATSEIKTIRKQRMDCDRQLREELNYFADLFPINLAVVFFKIGLQLLCPTKCRVDFHQPWPIFPREFGLYSGEEFDEVFDLLLRRIGFRADKGDFLLSGHL